MDYCISAGIVAYLESSSRPTNTQIRRLEDENSQLRRSLARLRSQASSRRVPDAENDSIDMEMNSSSQLSYQESTSHPLPSSSPPSTLSHKKPCFSTGDREVQFHGPSSAMFDESHQQTNTVASRITADPLHKYQLLGSSMKQRMAINTTNSLWFTDYPQAKWSKLTLPLEGSTSTASIQKQGCISCQFSGTDNMQPDQSCTDQCLCVTWLVRARTFPNYS